MLHVVACTDERCKERCTLLTTQDPKHVALLHCPFITNRTPSFAYAEFPDGTLDITKK
jgi:hypothetical protein